MRTIDQIIGPTIDISTRAERYASEMTDEEVERVRRAFRKDRAVVVWIPIETRWNCTAVDMRPDAGPMRAPGSVCHERGTWEELRALDPDGRPIDLGRPRLRCDEHFPASTPEVEHRKDPS